MRSLPVVLALIIVALVLGIVEVARTKGQSLPGWGVISLSVAGLWPLLT